MGLNFLETVKGALLSLGKEPYDDKNTQEVLSAASKRTVEYLEENAKVIEHTSDFIAVTKAKDEKEISLDEFNNKYDCHLGE